VLVAQCCDRSAILEGVLPVLPGNMFIFLIAGHEVGFSRSSFGVALNKIPIDHSTYIMLLICIIGTLS
jgi:hypothetical protein